MDSQIKTGRRIDEFEATKKTADIYYNTYILHQVYNKSELSSVLVLGNDKDRHLHVLLGAVSFHHYLYTTGLLCPV